MEQSARKSEHRTDYDPNMLLDVVSAKIKAKNDAALCRALKVAPPIISKIRHKRLPLGASILIRMHEVSNLSIRELRDLMGDRRIKFRASYAYGQPERKSNN